MNLFNQIKKTNIPKVEHWDNDVKSIELFGYRLAEITHYETDFKTRKQFPVKTYLYTLNGIECNQNDITMLKQKVKDYLDKEEKKTNKIIKEIELYRKEQEIYRQSQELRRKRENQSEAELLGSGNSNQ